MKSIFIKEDTAVVKSYDEVNCIYELLMADGTLHKVAKRVLQFCMVRFPESVLDSNGNIAPGSSIRVQIRRDVNCVDRVFVNAAQCYWKASYKPLYTTQKKYVESLQVELKSSFLYAAKSSSDSNPKVVRKQSVILAREASAMSNSRIVGKIVVGVDDQSNVVGVEKEVEDTVKFQSVLRNDIAVCTNWSFAESIQFEWITEESHLICILNIPMYNKIVLVNGNEMWKRVDTDCVQLKGDYLIDSIKSWVA